MLAPLIDPNRAVVRFHHPIPLGTPMVPVTRLDGSAELWSTGVKVASARPLDARLDRTHTEPVPPHLLAVAERTWPRNLPDPLPSPGCFGCGPGRDGLGLRPGYVHAFGLHATSWSPPGPGPVPSWLIWAALDCAGAGPVMATTRGGTAVTGELAADIAGSIAGGQTLQLQSRRVSHSGRKIVVEVALIDRQGTPLAASTATWLQIAGEKAA
jgi:hypothetical protein